MKVVRAALAQHLGKLAITPELSDVRSVFRVREEAQLRNGAMQLVAMDGDPQHYPTIAIPLAGIYLDPSLAQLRKGFAVLVSPVNLAGCGKNPLWA